MINWPLGAVGKTSKTGPWISPRANFCSIRIDDVHLAGDEVTDRSLHAVCGRQALDTNPADDMDSWACSQKVEVAVMICIITNLSWLSCHFPFYRVMDNNDNSSKMDGLRIRAVRIG